MNRVEENAKVLKDMEKLNGDYNYHGSILVFFDMMTTALLDISKSLAIIADKCEDLNALEPLSGEWVGLNYDSFADGCPVYYTWKCSRCGYEHKGEEHTLTDFCPDCGAKMQKQNKDKS